MNESPFKNLWFFDLLGLISLIFICVVMARTNTEANRISMMHYNLFIKYKSLGTERELIKNLGTRMIGIDRIEKLVNLYIQNSMELQGHLSYTKASVVIPTRLDEIFRKSDLLYYSQQIVDSSLEYLHILRDTIFSEYLKETKIERKLVTEDDLKFGPGQDVPLTLQRNNTISRDSALNIIFASVDSFISQGFNVIRIAGHTDTTLNVEYNTELSIRRARYLEQALRMYVRECICKGDQSYVENQPIIIQITGYGKSNPLRKKKDETLREWWKRCRRVELLFGIERINSLVSQDETECN